MTSAPELTVIQIPVSDPRVAPLLRELGDEYSSLPQALGSARAGGDPHRQGRARRDLPLPRRGVHRTARRSAPAAGTRRTRRGRRLPPVRRGHGRAETDLDPLRPPPPRPRPARRRRAGTRGGGPWIPARPPHHRPASARSPRPVPGHRIHTSARHRGRPGDHRPVAVILPTAGNEIIGLLKGTSVVYVMSIGELFYQVQVIYGRNGRVIPPLLVATAWYVVLTSLLSVAQYYVDRRYARGADRTPPPPRSSARAGSSRPSRRRAHECRHGRRPRRPQELRSAQGAARRRPAGAGRRGHRGPRPVRLREVHAAAHHQPPGEGQPRLGQHRR
jgi:hypothetical protein